MEFKQFRDAMQEHFSKMCAGSARLFMADVYADALWVVYQGAFPELMNLMYRSRREHDCSACRHFIKQAGGLVAIKDGKLETIWDFTVGNSGYQQVADAMSRYVKMYGIKDVYLTELTSAGQDHSNEMTADGHVIRYDHFYLELPSICRSREPDSQKGELRTSMEVFRRALDELSMDAVDAVLELIDSNTLYRGQENRGALLAFKWELEAYKNLPEERERELFAWERSVNLPPSVSRIRNTAIGTLLVNISEGMDLDRAVSAYEAITAPANFKRPKPVYTAKMLEAARQKITELGYLDSLPRRFASLNDITVQNILFADRDVSRAVFGVSEGESFFGSMEKAIPVDPKKFSRVEEIGIDDFVSKVLPTARKMEVLFESRLSKNLVSLIAPKNRDSRSMFKWDNPFSWAYAGNMADSALKQNVKNAGGKVDCVLRFSIQWNDVEDQWDKNDEDAHCYEPAGHIYFGNKYVRSDGNLDVDIIHPENGIPAVENITWPNKASMRPGNYTFFVHCYSCRGGRTGFRAEIEFDGKTYAYDYRTPLKQDEDVIVATVTLDKNGNFSIRENLNSTLSAMTVWGLTTNQFIPVSVVMHSPNHWAGEKGIGAKYTFFMLDGCVNDEQPNPFYNEFLKDELGREHRRVMEALGAKAHVEDMEGQLSGVGFSHTQRGELIVRVHGSLERVMKIKF